MLMKLSDINGDNIKAFSMASDCVHVPQGHFEDMNTLQRTTLSKASVDVTYTYITS